MCSWAVQIWSAVDHFLLKTMSVVSKKNKKKVWHLRIIYTLFLLLSERPCVVC